MGFVTPATPTPAYVGELRRAMLPELMLVEDVARVLGVTPATARKAIRRGDVGRFVRIGRRLGVRRPEFLRTLDARQEAPARMRVVRDGEEPRP